MQPNIHILRYSSTYNAKNMQIERFDEKARKKSAEKLKVLINTRRYRRLRLRFHARTFSTPIQFISSSLARKKIDYDAKKVKNSKSTPSQFYAEIYPPRHTHTQRPAICLFSKRVEIVENVASVVRMLQTVRECILFHLARSGSADKDFSTTVLFSTCVLSNAECKFIDLYRAHSSRVKKKQVM